MSLTIEKTVMPPPPSFATVEKEEPYHFRSKIGEVMSSGMLKKFRQCPYAYHLAVTGQTKEKDSAAFRFGRAVHKIVLEGHQAFNKAYAIGGPMNDKTGKSFGVGTKAHDAWLIENGYLKDQVINEDEADVLITMANAVRKHTISSAWLDFGWPELVMRSDLHGVPCQIRMDWLTRDADGNYLIVDLKTVEDLYYFEYDARRYGYLHQLAFYRDVFEAAAGQPVSIAILAAEKKDPFRIGVWQFPVEVIDYYSAENKITLENFKICQVADSWPTGYEEPRTFSLKKEAV